MDVFSRFEPSKKKTYRPLIKKQMDCNLIKTIINTTIFRTNNLSMVLIMFTLFEKSQSKESQQLIIAARNNNLEQFHSALSKNLNINMTDEMGFSALHAAVGNGNNEMCQTLIQRGININCGNIIGQTPLHMAIIRNRKNTIDFLLENGADIHRANKAGVTPIDLAFQEGDIELLEKFTKFGLQKELAEQRISQIKEGNKIMEEKCLNYCKTIFSDDSFLIPFVMEYFKSLLNYKTKFDFITKLEELLNDTDFIENTALKTANDMEKFYYFFLTKIYTDNFRTDIFWTNKQGDIYPALVNLLLETAQHHGFHTSNSILGALEFQDSSPFMDLMGQLSAIGNTDPIIEYKLIEALSKIESVNFNEQNNKWGNTLLHFMISNAQSTACIRFITALTLINKENNCGLDVNILSTAYGTAPLHLAVAKGYRDVDSEGQLITNFLKLVEVLINAQANVNLKSGTLLGKQKKGVEMEISDLLGEQTPLHIACARRDIEMINLLMEHNADPTITNAEGLTSREVLELSYEKRKAIVDSISGEDLNNFVQYETSHSSEEHLIMCREALGEKQENILAV